MAKNIRSPLGHIPNPFHSHVDCFATVDEAKYAIRGVLRAYFGGPPDDEEDYLFFKSAVVRFEDNPQVDLDLDHRRRTLVFIFKEPKGESADKLKEQIRKQIQLEYAVLASESRGRAAISIYRSLESQAKEQIIETERKREKKRNP